MTASPWAFSMRSRNTSTTSPTLISGARPGPANSFIGTRPSHFRPTSISAKSFSMATTTPLTTEPSMALEEVKDSSSRSAKFSLLANELSSARAAVVLAIKSPRRPWVGGLPVRRSGKLCPGIKRRSRGAVQASGADAASGGWFQGPAATSGLQDGRDDVLRGLDGRFYIQIRGIEQVQIGRAHV